MATTRSTAGWIARALAWSVILGVGAVVTVAVLVPRIGGATPYTILTGSMRPHYPPGTLVVIRPVPVQKVGAGMVVTYQLNSGDATVVTHRVVAVGINGKSQKVFTTQGDANNTPDARPVLPVQVKGKLWYAVPYLGYVTNFVTGSQRHMALIIVISGLFSYAAWMFVAAGRDRRGRDGRPHRHLIEERA